MKEQFTGDVVLVKVGTNTLTTGQSGHVQLDKEAFAAIGYQLRQLADQGYGVILVSSGAITAGVSHERRRREEVADVTKERRYAARGWDIVVQQWKEAIGSSRVSSTLLTKREVHSESMRGMLLDVVDCCLAHGDVFVVNENDCLSDDEIKFGDNDTLAASLAETCARSGRFRSVQMVLLTDVNGLRRVASDASTLIRQVDDIDEVEEFATAVASHHSRGGMTSKIRAARIATAAGVVTTIASGREADVVACALAGEVGTCFVV